MPRPEESLTICKARVKSLALYVASRTENSQWSCSTNQFVLSEEDYHTIIELVTLNYTLIESNQSNQSNQRVKVEKNVFWLILI